MGGRVICEVARDWARVFAFLEANGLRTCEGLRTRLTSCDAAKRLACYACAGGKPRKMVKLKLIDCCQGR